MQWNGTIFFDTHLPFGLQSAPKIFSVVADALQWVFQQKGVTLVGHYLDDFITVGSQECKENLQLVCQSLGVPVVKSKTSVYLGFEVDTIQGVVCLPAEKLQRMLALVRGWVGRNSCKRRELESLLGHLQHMATVVCPGRTFVRQFIALLTVVRPKGRWLRLNTSTRADLVWWLSFMEDWNGVAMMPNHSLPLISLEPFWPLGMRGKVGS